VASAGPYASLHLSPDRQPRQHPTTRFFTGRMPFLPPNQQRQSTEGTINKQTIREKEFLVYVQFKVFEYYRGHKNNNIHGLPQQDF